MENDNSLSLLDHCKSCTTSCCTKGMVITTEANHTQILATGAADHFWKVSVPTGNFFINDFTKGSCQYLDTSGRCTIESVKPVSCRTYPVMPTGQNSVELKVKCPAVVAIGQSDAFKLYQIESRNLIRAQMAQTPYDAFCDGFDAYHARHSSVALKEKQATVTPPPENSHGPV